MTEPNDSILPAGVGLWFVGEQVELTPAFVELLLSARANYDWPSGTGAGLSQQLLVELEEDVGVLIRNLDQDRSQQILSKVSSWAGNNANAHAAIVNANANHKATMYLSLRLLVHSNTVREGLDSLARLPGLSLVIASKVYRFIAPQIGASVDRHSSYFFNSLDVDAHDLRIVKATTFRREWATGTHTHSRLATFTHKYFAHNRQEYWDVYLPLLTRIAEYLNAHQMKYTCAVTGNEKSWRPTDVEMAAYYWWSCNGAR